MAFPVCPGLNWWPLTENTRAIATGLLTLEDLLKGMPKESLVINDEDRAWLNAKRYIILKVGSDD